MENYLPYKRAAKDDGPEGVRAMIIRKQIDKYRTAAKKVLLKEFPELRDKIKENKMQQRGISVPGNPAALDQLLR